MKDTEEVKVSQSKSKKGRETERKRRKAERSENKGRFSDECKHSFAVPKTRTGKP